MIGEKNMKVNNTEFDYQIDYINKKIHLIDKFGLHNDNSLVNAVDPEFQQAFIKQYMLLEDIVDFDWIVYASNGIVAQFRGYAFAIISPKLPYLHKPYLEAMQTRRKSYGRE